MSKANITQPYEGQLREDLIALPQALLHLIITMLNYQL